MSQNPILRAIDQSFQRADVPDFRSGDSVRVHTLIKEVTRSASRCSRAW